jgi:cell division septation protein DedD
MDLKKCISELLKAHDCVIIPGFGGFIGNYAPAKIDPVHHTFSPPHKKLLFNINLNQNDGLLANHLAGSQRLDYTDACKRIGELVESWRHDLKSGKPCMIPEVGKLSMGREGNIQFEQERGVNLLPEAFGLASFISPPVTRGAQPSRFEQSTPVIARKAAERRVLWPRPLKWAAMLALPLGAVAIIGVTQFGQTRQNQVNDAGILSSVFSRFSSASLVDKKSAPQNNQDSQFQMEPTPSVFDLPAESNPETDQDAGTIAPSTGETDIRQNTPIREVSAEDNFAVIIGAFRIRENAAKLVADLKQRGISAMIYDRSRSGLHRVAIGTTASREEAEQLLENTKSGEFPGAWLLAK